MAFHLLYGEHPGSLIDTCLGKICEEAVLWPTRRGYIIVPETMKAEVERRYIEILKEKKGGDASDSAFMMIDIVSFSRFAYRLLSEVGGGQKKLLKPVTKTILIHRILQQEKEDFYVLSRFSDRVGFVAEVEEVLGDFYRYGVSGQMLLDLDLSGESDLTKQKIHDFGLLMTRLDAKVEQLGFAPERDSMKRLLHILELFAKGDPKTKTWPMNRLSFLKDASVWIMGFGENRNLTPEELNIVTLLETVVSKLTFTAVAESGLGDADTKEICHFGNQVVKSFRSRLAFSSVTEVGPSLRDAALAIVSGDYAERFCATREDLSVPAEIRVFSQISDELEYVAARIKEMVRFEGYRYRDITVVLCDQKEYRSALHAAFLKYGLDVFVDSKNPLIGTIWMQYMYAIMEMGCYNWELGSVMSFLKSGFVSLDPVTVQRFENFCLAHGLKNKKRILSCEQYADTPMEKEMIRKVLPVLQETAEALKPLVSAKTCAERAITLHDMTSGKRKMVEYYVDEWTKAGNQESALALAASYNAADDVLRALSEEIGEFPISLSNFCDAVITSISTQSLLKIPSFVDQVTITEPKNAYRRTCRAMFVVGPNRKNFPFTAPSEGYLKNREREMLSDKLSMDFPNHAKDQTYSDFFVAYALLDCPKEKIVFTMQNSEEPSSVVLFMKESYPKVKFFETDVMSLADPRVLKKEKMRSYIQDVLTNRIEVSEEEREKVLFIWKTRFEGVDLSHEEETNPALTISKDRMDARYPSDLWMSVSSVESYVKCPYSYFCDAVLRLSEREVMQVLPTNMGTIAHSIFEMALTEFRDEYLSTDDETGRTVIFARYCERDKEEWVRSLLPKAQATEHFAYCDDPAMKMEADCKLIAAATATMNYIFDTMDPTLYLPQQFEWGFGRKDSPSCDIELGDGRTVHFIGVIDRVDVNPKTNEFRILDYKTGSKEVDYDALYAGESVQLPAYLHVFLKTHPEMIPTGAGYIRVQNPKERTDLLAKVINEDTVATARKGAMKAAFMQDKFTMKASPEEMAMAGQFAISSISGNCEKIFDGEFPAMPAKIGKTAALNCQNCKFAFMCNGDKDSPKYRFLEKVPKLKKEDGKSMTKKDAFFATLRGEGKA
ncbi:MAG: PD-(D/E)XK nuclease family protein [Clostridiales bacterium]|nr:PD-(D/E)XK nuclease family protein [Clostridiales bacterium]